MALAGVLSLAACAAPDAPDNSGLRIVQRTPEQFCKGTARSVAADKYRMKTSGISLGKALEGGVPVIDAITRAVYGPTVRSETQAADAGTAACLAYFR